MKLARSLQIFAIALAMLAALLLGLAGIRTVISASDGTYEYCRDGVGLSATEMNVVPNQPVPQDWFQSKPSKVDWLVNQKGLNCVGAMSDQVRSTVLLVFASTMSLVRILNRSKIVGYGLALLHGSVLFLLLGFGNSTGPAFVFWTACSITALEVSAIAWRVYTHRVDVPSPI